MRENVATQTLGRAARVIVIVLRSFAIIPMVVKVDTFISLKNRKHSNSLSFFLKQYKLK